jgi:methyl-accepting chemotaxis protein
MDILSPLILLHENGYKALGRTKGDDDLRLVVAELEAKMACVAEGDLDVTVGFAARDDEIGELGRSFNHMVQQL